MPKPTGDSKYMLSRASNVLCNLHWVCVSQKVDEWWRKKPTIAGEGQTPVQRKLAEPDSFTGMYKSRFMYPPEWPPSGDIVPNPKRAMRILKETPLSDLTIPTRACDFRTEVEWRLSLRDLEHTECY
jgi:hypothetical protein